MVFYPLEQMFLVKGGHMYLAWFDADRKKPVAQKIAEAHQRYVTKFGRQPRVCLVNPEDMTTDTQIELRPLNNIGRNCFWIGMDESDEAELAVAAAAAENAPGPKRQRRAKAEPLMAAQPPAPIVLPETRLPVPEAAPKARRPRRERTAA